MHNKPTINNKPVNYTSSNSDYQNQNQQPLNHTKQLGNKQFSNYLKSMPETVQLIFSIEKYLEPYHPFYYNSLLIGNKGKSIQLIKTNLQIQLDALLKDKSFLQIMNHSIESRQKCLAKIKRQIAKSQQILPLFKKKYYQSDTSSEDTRSAQYLEAQGYSALQVQQSISYSIQTLSNIFIDLCRLRDMTIYIIQTIHKWRVDLESYSQRCSQHTKIQFISQGRPFYETVKADSNFIWECKLKQYIWMNQRNDPFLIRNVIKVHQLTDQHILERYFVEILFPKSQQIITKAVQAFQMLNFQYQPKLYNIFQEEELLIQNYLKMENQYLQETGIHDHQPKSSKQIFIQEKSPVKKKNNQLHSRGWVFQKYKLTAKQRVNQLVEVHQQKMNIIKPFAIANFSQKNSIALAYLSQAKLQYQNQQRRPIELLSSRNHHQNNSEGKELIDSTKHKHRKQLKNRSVHSQSERVDEPIQHQRQMYKSLTKLNQIIYEDPKEHLPETPKIKQQKINIALNKNINENKSNQKQQRKQQMLGREHSINSIKINTFLSQALTDNNNPAQIISVEEQETPLNMKQFLQVFRADTDLKSNHIKQSHIHKKNVITPLVPFKQYLHIKRQERAKSLPYLKKSSLFHVKKLPTQKQVKSNQLNNSLNKNDKSFEGYQKVKQKISQQNVINLNPNKIQHSSNEINEFLTLKPKSIPSDMIKTYVSHIISQQHSTSKSFTSFSSIEIQKKLEDPFIHCLIFDLYTQKGIHIGQVILSQSLGNRGGKLKYTFQFINIHVFQLIIASVLRVVEELLSTTPSEQIICPFVVDKLDPVSTHFIALIDEAFIKNTTKFGQLNILERKKFCYKGTDMYERLYLFASQKNIATEMALGLKMLGNYRSLKFESKCLVLTSNFKLRSKSILKNIIKTYQTKSLGKLYVKLFIRILTKYHLKQLKSAAMSNNNGDELVHLIKTNMFLRNIIIQAIPLFKEQSSVEEIDLNGGMVRSTRFSNMTDLLNYLNYKHFSSDFHFNFLEQSRFILDHQLILSQFQTELSLQFLINTSPQLYILHNNHKFHLKTIISSNSTLKGYLLPTTNQNIQLFLLDAKEYQQKTDAIDLYSYLCHYMKCCKVIGMDDIIGEIVMPNLSKCNAKINKVKMFEGFSKFFPERQFYSAAMINCMNLWESYYPSAVVYMPSTKALTFQFPLLIGFYDHKHKEILTCFLYQDQRFKQS